VQQAVDLTTGEQVAIKFIERSQEVRGAGRALCTPGAACVQAQPRGLGQALTGWSGGAGQVSKYVEREILNHKRLIHPHIVQLKEVRSCVCQLRRRQRRGGVRRAIAAG
jgi:serine/threonine protein kinase